MIKFIKENGNRCAITGISDYESTVCINRLTDELDYHPDNCILLNVRVNFAKANLVAFFSSDNFNEYYDIEKSDKQIKLEKCSDIIKDILLQAIIMKRKNNYKLELEYPVIII
ncbi:unnamed protein product [Cunninghamella blakesleeana]